MNQKCLSPVDFANHLASTIETDPQILDFIAYFNRILAKPFNWKFEGFPEPE